jgi:alkenylglycerophosphocholine/alkenylglycerophosphoethanolamine hydrolase
MMKLGEKKRNTMNTNKTSQFHRLTFIYVASASAFLVLLAMDRVGIVRTVLKAIPMSTLLFLVLRDMRGFARICLAGALIGSVCGDVLLDLPYASVFVFGLSAFLIGHLFYTVLFFRYAKSSDGFGKATVVGLVIFAGVMVWIFRDITPTLFGPVVLYIVVIITMSIGAFLVPAENRLLFMGALLFIASDVVLAVNKFLFVIPYGRVINISLYFIAQFIIIMAARTIWVERGDEGAQHRY